MPSSPSPRLRWIAGSLGFSALACGGDGAISNTITGPAGSPWEQAVVERTSRSVSTGGRGSFGSEPASGVRIGRR